MMTVLIEEIKEVMCASLLELLNSNKQLDQEQSKIFEMQEKIAYYKDSFAKITEQNAKCLVIREDFKNGDELLFRFDEQKQSYLA